MNSIAVDRCESCGALVDLEDLFCANCGREVPDRSEPREGRPSLGARGFECKNCGASMAYDAKAQALRCPFCGSGRIEEDGSKGVLAPEILIPFAIGRDEAAARLRGWLGSSLWHPQDLNAAAVLTELKPVYVPYWIFRARVETHWTADTDRTPPRARAPWFPASGHGVHEYDNLWVPASEGITGAELGAIGDFDAAAAVTPDAAGLGLDGVAVEQFSLSRRYARPGAQGRVEALEASAIAAELGGRTRKIRVNSLLIGATSRAALAPVYVMAYRYRDHLYRFVLNGQTGTFTGQAPLSYWRVVAAAALIAGLVLAVLALVPR